MSRIFNTFSKFALCNTFILGVIISFVVRYIINTIMNRGLIMPVADLFSEFMWYIPLIFFLAIIMSKCVGYALSDEGIGKVSATKGGWKYGHFVKWDEIIMLKYKPSKIKFLGYDRLLIYRDKEFKVLIFKSNYIAIDSSQRDFKEIVDIVCEKTKLPLEMYSK